MDPVGRRCNRRYRKPRQNWRFCVRQRHHTDIGLNNIYVVSVVTQAELSFDRRRHEPSLSTSCAKVLLAACSLAAQPAMLLYLDWRQVGYLRLRELEPNAVVNPGHRTDRDGDLLLGPQMSFLEENVGYLVVTWIDEEPTDMPDRTVGCMDALSSSHFDLAWWDPVVVATCCEAPGAAPAHAACVLRSEIGHQQPLLCRIDELAVRCWDKLALFGVVERLELDPSAAQPQFLLCRRFDELDWDQPADVMAVPPLYDKVGDGALDRVDNHPLQLPARAVCTVDLGSDGVLCCSAHVRAPLRRRALEAALRGDRLPLPFLHSNP
jgi:hypothetical protein